MSIDSGELIHNVFSLSNIRHICFLDLYGDFIFFLERNIVSVFRLKCPEVHGFIAM